MKRAGAWQATRVGVDLLDFDRVFSLLVEHEDQLDEWVASRPDALQSVTPEQVSKWLGPCAGKEAVTIIGK